MFLEEMVDIPDQTCYTNPMEHSTRRRPRSDNLIGRRATILRAVQAEQRRSDTRNTPRDDDHPFRRPNEVQHPTSRAFERKQLGLEDDE